MRHRQVAGERKKKTQRNMKTKIARKPFCISSRFQKSHDSKLRKRNSELSH